MIWKIKITDHLYSLPRHASCLLTLCHIFSRFKIIGMLIKLTWYLPKVDGYNVSKIYIH